MRSILAYSVSTQHINIVLQQGLIWAGYLVSTSYNSSLLGWYVECSKFLRIMRLCPIWFCTSDPKFKMLLFSRRQFLYSCYKFWMLFSEVYFFKFDKLLPVLLPIRWSAVRISWFLYLIWGTILFSCILKFKSNLKFDKLSPVLLPFKQPQSESLECSEIYCTWLTRLSSYLIVVFPHFIKYYVII